MASLYLHLLHSFLLLLALILPLIPKVFSINCTVSKRLSLSSQTSLQENPAWLSRSGEFAFGFRKQPNGTENLFLLAIWFDKIPEKTIVWSANGNNPAPEGSTVNLTDDGRLVVYDPKGGLLWEPQTNGINSTCAAMNDDGNFMLLDAKNNPIWETFKEPTDTVLPGQTLNMSSKLC